MNDFCYGVEQHLGGICIRQDHHPQTHKRQLPLVENYSSCPYPKGPFSLGFCWWYNIKYTSNRYHTVWGRSLCRSKSNLHGMEHLGSIHPWRNHLVFDRIHYVTCCQMCNVQRCVAHSWTLVHVQILSENNASSLSPCHFEEGQHLNCILLPKIYRSHMHRHSCSCRSAVERLWSSLFSPCWPRTRLWLL